MTDEESALRQGSGRGTRRLDEAEGMGGSVKPSARVREWREGWPTVLASSLCLACCAVPSFVLGSLFSPLQAAFGWSRGELALSAFLGVLASFAAGRWTGGIIDRWGVRKAALLLVPYMFICFGLLATTGPALWTWYVVWILKSVVLVPTLFGLWMSAITKRFDAARGSALAVTLSGSAIATAVAPPLIVYLIETLGWRLAVVAIAAGALAIVLCIVAIFNFDRAPAKSGAVGEDGAKAPHPEATEATPREALRSLRFWLFAASMFVIGGATSTIGLHLQPMLIDAGLTRREAAAHAAMVAPFLIVGRLGVGILYDRVNPVVVSTLAFIVPMIACYFAINLGSSPAILMLFPALVGLALGMEQDIAAYMTGRFFGRKNYGALYMLVGGLSSVGAGAMASFAGFIFDIAQTYVSLMWTLIVGLAVAVLGVMQLSWSNVREPRRPQI